MKTSISSVLFFCWSIAAVSQVADHALNNLIEEVRSDYEIPAIVAAIVKLDTCYYGIRGTAKLNGTDQLPLNSKFHLGSNTKAITSFIAMKMIEQDQVQLNTLLTTIIPEFKDHIKNKYKEVTLGELLSHQAGIQPYTTGSEYEKIPELSGDVLSKRMEFSKFVLNEKAVDRGTYSNAGYIIAATMLEKAAGKPFEDLVQEVMDELKLDYFLGFPAKENDQNPWGHWMEKGKLKALPPNHFYHLKDYALSAGDVSMDIVNYAAFIQLHLKGLNGQSNALTPAHFQQLHFGMERYSYGWGNAEDKKNKVSFHDGSAGTFYCHTHAFS